MTPQPLSHEMWFAQLEVYLHQQGYRAKTAHRYRTVCRQFLQYLQERDIALEQVEPAILEAYLQAQCRRYEQRHGRAPRQAHHLFNRGIPLFLRLVHGHWPPPTLPTRPQACWQQQVCEGYAQWLARCRGLAPRTIASRHARAQKLLAWLNARGTLVHLRDLSVADLDAYLAAQEPTLRRSTRADLTCSLRDFLRYLYAHGLLTHDLAPTVLSPTLYAFERLLATLT